MKTIPKTYILLIFCLYVTQYTGYGFFLEAFITILRKNGVGLQYLGLIYMLGLFTVFRFLWAPFIDRVRFGKYGHYKSWLFATQSLIAVSFLAISFCTISQNLLLILVFMTLFSFLASTQYSALDGFIFKTLSHTQRATGNAIKISGGMVGTLLGSGVGLILYTHLRWQNTIWIFTAFAIFSMFLLLIHNEKESQKEDDFKSVKIKDILRYWIAKERRIWLQVMILSPISVAVFFGLTSRILVDKHWQLDKIGLIVNILGFTVGGLTSLLAPFLIAKFNKKIVLYIGLIGQTLGLSLLIFILHGFTSTAFVGMAVSFTYTFYPLMGTVIATLMMDNIKNNSPAFEYSIQHSVNMLSSIIAAGMSIFLASFIGYENVIYLGIVFGLLALIPARKMEMS